MGELNRQGMLNKLGEIANSGSSSNGSFVYDEATLRSLVTKWVELADHYYGSLRRTSLGAVQPPGKDVASEALAKSANTSGTAYMTYLEQNFNYCIRQAQLLQDTLDNYLGVEHHSVMAMTRAGSGQDSQPTDSSPNSGL
jgi:hypothetical protein